MVLTLRHKVNGAIVVTFILIAIVFSLILLPFQQNRVQSTISNIEILLETLVERDSEELANEIFDARFKALSIRIKQMRKVKGILGISLFDPSGKRLVRDGVEPENLDISGRAGDLTGSGVLNIRIKGKRALLFSEDIRFLGEQLGVIRICYSLEEIEKAQRNDFILFGGLLGTILLLMLIVLNTILSKAILHPITYLKDAAGFIAQGNLEENIDMNRGDELGSLANSFEKMRDAVKEKIVDLERSTNILESTSDLVAIASPDQSIFYMNKAGRKMLGWAEGETLEEKSIADLHPEAEYRRFEKAGLPAAGKFGTWESETLLIRSDGKQIPVSLVIILHKTIKGREAYISAIMRDISLTKAAEKELRYLRNYLANIIDSMPSILVGVDKKGRITQWNQAAQKATGLEPVQAQGMDLEKVLPDLSSEKDKVMTALRDRSIQTGFKVKHQEQDQIIFHDVTVYPLKKQGMEGAVIRIDDVTEKVRFEEMMIQTEKMLSVGGLAAGMAHEINNPLAGVIQNANVLANRLNKDSAIPANLKAAERAGITMEAIHDFMDARSVPQLLSAIINSGVRIASIVENMLSFSRKGDASFSKHAPVDLLEKVLELAETDFDLKQHFDFRSIKISKEYQENLPEISCEKSKIQQVLLNILSNGAHAMSGMQNPEFNLRLTFEAGMLKMEIKDNGPGMDETIRKRIFEPFFTTKPVGIGTGLGLSVSYFIITEHHGGKMDVVSEPGRGSNFIIHLPLDPLS